MFHLVITHENMIVQKLPWKQLANYYVINNYYLYELVEGSGEAEPGHGPGLALAGQAHAGVGHQPQLVRQRLRPQILGHLSVLFGREFLFTSI